MQLYYAPNIVNGMAVLDEVESRHIATVLRHQPGDELLLTDGQGMRYRARIEQMGKKEVTLKILEEVEGAPAYPFRVHVGIAPTKQIDRFEWFLEKATELGVNEITPLLCKHSERSNLRMDRLERILIAAMKQSLRDELPTLHPITPFETWVGKVSGTARKLMAWLPEGAEPQHLNRSLGATTDVAVAIGPEGDFHPDEVALANASGFENVSLGAARLRTETAGVFAVALLRGGVT